MVFRSPGYAIDGEDLFQLPFGSDARQSGEILGAAFGGMPTAVSTIRRGEPDNWGTLFEELHGLTASGDWPPADYTPNFWESRDGR
jgi:hypothetical protein